MPQPSTQIVDGDAVHQQVSGVAMAQRVSADPLPRRNRAQFQATAPALVEAFGVGSDTAAALLIAAGSNPDRLNSEAAFASLCGVSPVPASSGKTNRHRLNRGGDRQANAALYRIVVVRLRYDLRTQAYLRRRTAEGMSKVEVIRCLKRYVAREVYSIIRKPAQILEKAA